MHFKTGTELRRQLYYKWPMLICCALSWLHLTSPVLR
jgi:hypothetical protein